MMPVTTPIIPVKQTFAKVDASHELHLEAICVFAAIGFFLDTDTYWKDEVVLSPGAHHLLDSKGYLIESQPWFKWHYSPRDISFSQALEAFTDLFETIIKERTAGKRVILPLSGGLDSRTQAVALKYIGAEVFSYSYEFKNGYKETKIAKQIAAACGFDFNSYLIEDGYLWGKLDTLFQLNHGYSDFTHPRQMAIYDQYASMGDVFSLGHWGDVLFDSTNLPPLTFENQVEILTQKLLKRGGLQFASDLWNAWGLDGHFEMYFKQRIGKLLAGITIEDTNAKLRAFKSMYWAPRWTSINLSIYESVKPISLPYYDDRMCQFICTIPEVYLKGRQLQMAYIKKRSPELANINWEAQRPFNLNTYMYNRFPYNFPYKVLDKMKRECNSLMGNSYVQRNWELQFLGIANKKHLEHYLFENGLERFVDVSIIDKFYKRFSSDPLLNAQAINTLLVLSKFNTQISNV